MKTIKFRDFLAEQVMSGEKTVTWRLFDDKDLSVGDEVELINWNTGEVFGKATLTGVKEKKLGDINEDDYVGHEKFESKEEMYETYKKYYGDKVNLDTIVKIIKFELI